MPIQILSNNKMVQLENNLHKTEQSTHRVYMQFILITKHKHMYINNRIIQTKQKRFFPFFSFFVNRYDMICILIAESYKKSFFSFFIPF